jgi:hypothetical protein
MKNKFEIGDKVKVVNYGHLMWSNKKSGMKMKLPIISEDGNIVWHDFLSKIVGKVGVVVEVIETQGIVNYSLNGIPQKTSWYNEEQLELEN